MPNQLVDNQTGLGKSTHWHSNDGWWRALGIWCKNSKSISQVSERIILQQGSNSTAAHNMWNKVVKMRSKDQGGTLINRLLCALLLLLLSGRELVNSFMFSFFCLPFRREERDIGHLATFFLFFFFFLSSNLMDSCTGGRLDRAPTWYFMRWDCYTRPFLDALIYYGQWSAQLDSRKKMGFPPHTNTCFESFCERSNWIK